MISHNISTSNLGLHCSTPHSCCASETWTGLLQPRLHLRLSQHLASAGAPTAMGTAAGESRSEGMRRGIWVALGLCQQFAIEHGP
jgi:hypothetical protein